MKETWKKNKGEWSELYAFLALLDTGKLYAADENANRLNDIYFPILEIFRDNSSKELIDYVIGDENIDVYYDGGQLSSLEKSYLAKVKELVFNGIVSGKDRTFKIQGAPEAMSTIHIDKIKASSNDKADITMRIHDIHTGYEPLCGFSIKSLIGSAPTLFNASGSTNFLYEINGIDNDDIEHINAIQTKHKIIDRIEAINKLGSIKFVRAENNTFASNMMMIDSFMESIVGNLLLLFFQKKAKLVKDLVEKLEQKNPLKYPRKGLYEYKVKKFLSSVALGMIPSKEWDGQDEASGGYVIVKKDGEVLAYHIYNRNAFESYLFNNTKLDTASALKHGFGQIYKTDNHYYIKLGLQIRFI